MHTHNQVEGLKKERFSHGEMEIGSWRKKCSHFNSTPSPTSHLLSPFFSSYTEHNLFDSNSINTIAQDKCIYKSFWWRICYASWTKIVAQDKKQFDLEGIRWREREKKIARKLYKWLLQICYLIFVPVFVWCVAFLCVCCLNSVVFLFFAIIHRPYLSDGSSRIFPFSI